MTDPAPDPDRLDAALAKRLAQLAGTPVDTTRLQRRLREAMRNEGAPRAALPLRRWWRPLSSVAAALVAVGVIGWLLVAGSSPAVAAPNELFRLHQGLVDGEVHAELVSGVDEANRQIAAQWAQAPRIPRPNRGSIKSCCLHRVQDVRVACVLMEYAGQPVTLVVAPGKQLCSAKGLTITRAGRQFIAHKQDGLQMVMTHHDDRWLCVMGELPTEQLVDLAEGIVF